MSSPVSFLAVVHCLRTLSLVAVDLIRLVAVAARPRAALVAENLFLRKQLALFQERKVRPRRADASTRWMMAALSQWFAWRDALVNVQADTLLRWHRQGFRLFWRWKSKTAGRPRLPNNLQAGRELKPRFCRPSSRRCRTSAIPSACRSLYFETSNSPWVRASSLPTRSIITSPCLARISEGTGGGQKRRSVSYCFYCVKLRTQDYPVLC